MTWAKKLFSIRPGLMSTISLVEELRLDGSLIKLWKIRLDSELRRDPQIFSIVFWKSRWSNNLLLKFAIANLNNCLSLLKPKCELTKSFSNRPHSQMSWNDMNEKLSNDWMLCRFAADKRILIWFALDSRRLSISITVLFLVWTTKKVLFRARRRGIRKWCLAKDGRLPKIISTC